MYINKTIGRRSGKSGNFKVERFTDETEINEVVPFKSLLIFLSLFGGLPCTWRKPHYPSLHLFKSTVLPAVVIFGCLSVFVYISAKLFMHRLLTEPFQLNEKIMHVQLLTICIAATALPLASWSDVHTIRRGIFASLMINSLYQQVTNKKVTPRWPTLEKVVIVVTLILPPLTFIIGKEAIPEIQITYEFYLPCVHPCTLMFLISSLWIGNFANLEALAKDINTEFKQSVTRKVLNLEKLLLYQKIWFEMRYFMDTLSSLNTPVIIFLIGLVSIICFVYTFLVSLSMGKYFALLPNLLLGGSIMILLSFMARTCQVAVQQIKVLYSEILARAQLMEMEESLQRQVISLYLIENMRTSLPTYGGFITVNKALVLTILGTVSVHLVMLAQLAGNKV